MTEPANLDRYETLTPSEREVLRLVAEGLISAETVETQHSDLMQKLDLHTHADLIRFALRRGIVLMEDEGTDKHG